MIISMTGFATTLLSLPKPAKNGIRNSALEHMIHLSITLKTVNARFFEVNCKLPYSLASLENDITKLLKAKLYRGTIHFTIHMSDPSAFTGEITPAIATAQGYLTALEQIKQALPIEGSVKLSDLINLPNIFETKEGTLPASITEKIFAAITELIEKCNQVRVKEGESLKGDLFGRIAVCKDAMQKLEPRAQIVLDQRREQLITNLKTILEETNQEGTAESQTALVCSQLDKLDLHEEIVRFKTHLANLTTTIEAPDIEKGKKLDFTLQELFREINTIASKCNDAQISTLAIDIKVELEKAREQAQNIV